MVKRLIVPGLEGSGEGHWQRWWLTQDPDARIVEQDDWHRPDFVGGYIELRYRSGCIPAR